MCSILLDFMFFAKPKSATDIEREEREGERERGGGASAILITKRPIEA